MTEWINTIVQGILLGGLYAIFAAGLSLIFGVMRLVNIAHGDLIVLAAYVALLVTTALGINPVLSNLALPPANFRCLPLWSLARRTEPLPPSGPQVAVVLVHGYLSNRGYFAPMVRWLEARGVARIIVPNYRSVFSDIESSANELHAAIERLAAGGVQQVVLVCHSMGGLLARRYLQEHGEARVARLVTIASPHHGTVLSRLGVGGHARQMRQGSDFLRALDAAEAARAPQVPATSIYSVHDNLVTPQDTSRLDWARNVALAGVGHVGIIAHEPVYALVMEELRAPKPPG